MARDKLSRDVEGMTAMQLAKEVDNPDVIRALTFGKNFRCQIVDDDDEVLMHATSLLRLSFPCLSLKSSVLNHRVGPANRLGSHRWQFNY